MEKKVPPDFGSPAKTIVVQTYHCEDDADDLKSWGVSSRQRASIFFTLVFSSIVLVSLYLWATSYTDAVLKNVCKEPPEFLVHNIQRPSSIRQTDINDYIARTVAENVDVEFGGRWMPHDCIPHHNVVVIIPFLGDNFQLWTLLRHLHPILKRQKLHYQILVVENQSNSTSGAMLNAGQILNTAAEQANYKAMKDDKVCLIFLYPSILPATDEEYFGCVEGTVKIFAEDRAGFIVGMFADDFGELAGFRTEANEPRTLIEDLRKRSSSNYLRVESRLMRYHDMNRRLSNSDEMMIPAPHEPAEVVLQFERSRRLFTHLAVTMGR